MSVPSSSFACRPACGACCIAPSISSLNKPAGEPCRHLDEALRCRIFGRPERPKCCAGLQASAEMCGETREHAMRWLAHLEVLTHPG
ncbi:YkgJ family cysteine cluster protein [Dechloromonas sp. XY25]|uniref:YkgJ family cysteine cluster protein n=1 Tax=Dechloromonas hankyongensis TaxID=2908002 RepID=A0ABS9JX99_9RHOO|nr:YkgJ family cysteine cluster protein [Dechloromonas hankyongensis]MCG2575524.1 YkgJ family cysteine cluster protein [Dechloromonas hankyongensis]